MNLPFLSKKKNKIVETKRENTKNNIYYNSLSTRLQHTQKALSYIHSYATSFWQPICTSLVTSTSSANF